MFRDFLFFCKYFYQAVWATRTVLLVLPLLITLGGLILYLEEGKPFFDMLYLSFITAWTVGYGDLAPTTPLAKFTAVIIGFIGLIFIGLCVAIATIAVKKILEDKETK